MLFWVDPRIWKEFPDLVIGIVVAHNITNVPNKDAEQLLKDELDYILTHVNPNQINELEHIRLWKQAYEKFGANADDYLPSVENLIRRLLNAKSLRSINPLVDIYNAISLKYLVPAGAEDLDALSGSLELTIAGPDERSVPLLGERTASKPVEGEIIYKDSMGPTCRRWNWKQADRTKVTNATTNALICIEGLGQHGAVMVPAAAHELAARVQKMCGGTVSYTILTSSNPYITLKDSHIYTSFIPAGNYNESLGHQWIAKADHNVEHHQNSPEYYQRVNKLEKLEQLSIEPWAAPVTPTATAQMIIQEFEQDSHAKEYSIAGRIVASRLHGKVLFAQIQDRTGKIQIYARKDEVGDQVFDELKHLYDIGDIVFVQGSSFRTQMGEITLKVDKIQLLSKCLHPLPEKFHGLSDIETIYRQRYLDLIANKESRNRFAIRSRVIRTIRTYLDSHEFVEVETPMLHPIPGGAAARPFVTHHNALNTDLYLRIAPELYLKRLVVGGFERVYEINRNFRNEGISTRHNPEFTMIELYMAHHDYIYIMNFIENMFLEVARAVVSDPAAVVFGERILNFAHPFTRLRMDKAICHYLQCSPEDVSPERIDILLKQYEVKLPVTSPSYGQKVYALFEEQVEHKIIQPTFITHFPIEVSPLAKEDPEQPGFAARFELFIAGMEISNGFNELNNPFEQAERFKGQVEARQAGDQEAHYYDADYITALEYGLPPTVGVGIGIDRLSMLLTNASSIKDVILFPTLKRK